MVQYVHIVFFLPDPSFYLILLIDERIHDLQFEKFLGQEAGCFDILDATHVVHQLKSSLHLGSTLRVWQEFWHNL
jgi:hypothetical protein